MPRGPVVYTLPPGTTPQIAGTTIEPAVFNAFANDVANTFNTVQPPEYGGTGAPTLGQARINLGAAGIGDVPSGNCRLILDGANIKLIPYNGNGLSINGEVHSVPGAGITLAPTGLSPSTNYFIYAYMNSTTMTLEASTTGHSLDASSGIEIKTGDSTRTLVGMVRMIAGPAFTDSLTQRFVISWFNRRAIALSAVSSPDLATSSTTYVELSSSFRIAFLSWGEDVGSFSLGASALCSSFPVNMFCSLSLNNSGSICQSAGASFASNTFISLSCSGVSPIPEGWHFVSMRAAVGQPSTMTVPGLTSFSSAPANIQGFIRG